MADSLSPMLLPVCLNCMNKARSPHGSQVGPILERSLGYSKRFGMVHVKFETLIRTPKDSAKLYSRIIASNGEQLV